MEEKTIEYKGKRNRAVQGACSEDCALWDVCNPLIESEVSQLCAEHFTSDDGLMWEEIPNHVTDASNKVDQELAKETDFPSNRIRPDYYVINGIEVKDLLGEMSFNVGNAMKYLVRHGRKIEQGMTDAEKAIEDLRKAKAYIEFEIERLKK